MPQVLYIAGYGHSGSTLLDVLLGHHPQVFGAGELTKVFAQCEAGQACSCGQPHQACPFWTRVRGRFDETPSGLTSAAAAAITRRVEASLSPRRLTVDRPDCQAYGRVWRTELDAIADASGCRVIVDSSKSSHDTGRRALALNRLAGIDVKVIHLVRDPRAVMWSVLRRSKRAREAGEAGRRGEVYRALIGWSLANTTVHWSVAGDERLQVYRLRYEDLVGRPTEALRVVGDFAGLDLGSVIDAVAEQRTFGPGHGVGGNHMRRQGPIQLRVDEEWKRALPAGPRWAALSTWPLTRTYGYNVWPPAARGCTAR